MLEIDAIRKGTNLKAYIEKMCDEKAEALKNTIKIS